MTSVRIGTRLESYEIVGHLGSGGMGDVYRARDERLGRDVAIKFLPERVAGDAERLARFRQEARSAGTLNHPNLVTIFDIGTTAEGSAYIVMELLEGKTLRAVIEEGEGHGRRLPIPLRRFCDYSTQIARGLAAAHERRIIHRDLKPENIFITSEGRVKILDFGLAKQQTDTTPDAATAPLETAPGTVMGTASYMSPEQARGTAVDHRSDIFSFGVILFELLTGERPFDRDTVTETLASIIRDDPPDLATMTSDAPLSLRLTVQHCLEKKPEDRFQSARDLGFQLSSLTTSSQPAPVPVLTARRRWSIPATIGAAILLACGLTGWWLQQRDYFWKNPLAGARFTRLTDWEGSELDASISSDGKFIAFLAERNGPFEACLSQVGSAEFLNLTKGQFPALLAEQVRNLGFSGDESHVWLRVSGKSPQGDLREHSIWLIPALGGAPQPFLAKGVSVVWSPDRSRIAYHTSDPGDPIFVADRNGGNPRQIFISNPGVHNHHPAWSPDGRFIYFARGIPTTWRMDIWRIPSNGGAAERLTHHNSQVGYPTFLDERTLIYTATGEDGSGLYEMDVKRRMSHRVSFGMEEYISIAASSDGRRLVASVATPTRDLWTVPLSDRIAEESEVRRFAVPAVSAGAPRFGPDYLLYLSSKGAQDGLWKLKDGAAAELWRGSEGAVVGAPAISANGSQIAFPVRGEQKSRLYVMGADGTNARPIAESVDAVDTPSWSPDGRWIAVCAFEGKGQPLVKVPIDGGPPIRMVEGVVYSPVWSPDGRFIVYSLSHGGGSWEVKAVTAEGRALALPEMWVRYNSGAYRFLPGGKALVVLLGAGRHQNFWLLDLQTLRLRQLTNLRQGFVTKSFDISSDGKTILFERDRENSDIVLIDLPPR